NLQYYKPGHPETEVATMGCRTRVMGNAYDRGREISYSRGNLSFTSINLPRIAIESAGDEKLFYKKLDAMLELVAQQLADRFEIQAKKRVYNYPFLMGQGVWLDSDKLNPEDEVREVLKHGTLSIGFIGLAETLTALYGQNHGESTEIQKKGLEIVGYMRDFCDKRSAQTQMNYTLLGTPAEGLSGRFVRMDAKRYGIIKNVTDREYYTNSFHIPVWYNISAYDKIRLEAPYHALTNAGHISYVELDGDTANNVEAFESIVRCMHDANIGYGSINHPVDRDPVCGYVGVIGEVCPRCGRKAGEALSKEQLDAIRKKYSCC
ncbi:MAG: anaerobic ribonucleoside-triphosphate reductase, partial [Oscillospiraceae bacterium]